MAKSEFCVLPGSVLIGKTIHEAEVEYGIRIDHIHNPSFSSQSKKTAEPNRRIDERLILKVEGNWDSVGRIVRDSVAR